MLSVGGISSVGRALQWHWNLSSVYLVFYLCFSVRYWLVLFGVQRNCCCQFWTISKRLFNLFNCFKTSYAYWLSRNSLIYYGHTYLSSDIQRNYAMAHRSRFNSFDYKQFSCFETKNGSQGFSRRNDGEAPFLRCFLMIVEVVLRTLQTKKMDLCGVLCRV